jgi:xylan 1,4-beta-xylosidase
LTTIAVLLQIGNIPAISRQAYSFYIATETGQWQPLAERVDGHILSTPLPCGFVGAYIGMVAGSSSLPSVNKADFDWFEYSSQDE